MTDVKTCSKCGVCKPLGDFTRRLDRPSGYASQCKRCVGAATKDYWARNPQKLAAKKHSHYLRHSEKLNAKTRAREASLPVEELRAYKREKLAKYRGELRDSYVLTSLRARSGEVSPELINLKREQLFLHRLAKTLKGAANKAKENQ